MSHHFLMKDEQFTSQDAEQFNKEKQTLTNLQKNNKSLSSLLLNNNPIPPPPSFDHENNDNQIPLPPSFDHRINAPLFFPPSFNHINSHNNQEYSSEIEDITDSNNEPRELKKDYILIHIKPTSSNPIKTLYLNKYTKIIDIKRKYEDISGIPIDQQTYFFIGKKLQNDHFLNDYPVDNQSTISLAIGFK